MNNLAASYADAGQYDRAIKLHEETLALRRAKLGPDHPDTLRSMSILAESYADAGQTDRAMKLYEETLALQKAKLGPDHPIHARMPRTPGPMPGEFRAARPRRGRSSTRSSRRVARPRATATPIRSDPG